MFRVLQEETHILNQSTPIKFSTQQPSFLLKLDQNKAPSNLLCAKFSFVQNSLTHSLKTKFQDTMIEIGVGILELLCLNLNKYSSTTSAGQFHIYPKFLQIYPMFHLFYSIRWQYQKYKYYMPNKCSKNLLWLLSATLNPITYCVFSQYFHIFSLKYLKSKSVYSNLPTSIKLAQKLLQATSSTDIVLPKIIMNNTSACTHNTTCLSIYNISTKGGKPNTLIYNILQ
eukprot:TRINITY_DN3859_c0_g1_i18.p2 TRINITY_DN3859_c0_g1~~TRINITY_DN3859_c0_g1_i18.p2  ORF type:complete len:227 (+),score=-14.29 TRINITY_DN3859_c0_g1_i18:1690-2370(+)